MDRPARSFVAPRFTPAFHTDFTQVAEGPAVLAIHPRPVLASDEKYRAMSIEQFMASPDYARCEQEYLQMIDRIAHFVTQHAAPMGLTDATKSDMLAEFALLKEHLSDRQSDFFANHKSVVYGTIKEQFHELERQLNDGRIPIAKKFDALQAMAPQLGACSGGLVTVVGEGVSNLKYGRLGLAGAAHRVKLQMANQLICEFVRDTHDYAPDLEVHYVNVYHNHLAPHLGLPLRQDIFTSIVEPEITQGDLDACQTKVMQRMAPGALTRSMGSDYLDHIQGAVAASGHNPTEAIPSTHMPPVLAEIEKLSDALLNPAFGPVPHHAFLHYDADTDRTELPKQPTLLALHFMHELREHALIDFSKTITLVEGGASEGDIMQLGDLFWRKTGADCDEIDDTELFQSTPEQLMRSMALQDISPNEQGALLQHIVQNVCDFAQNTREVPGLSDWIDGLPALLTSVSNVGRQWTSPAIMLAAIADRTATMQQVIVAGASPNHVDDHGNTPLSLSVERGNENTARLLIATGADVNMPAQWQMTPLMFAAGNGHLNLLQQLIAAGADVDAADVDFNTAAMYAAMHNRVAELEALAHTCELDADNVTGTTALLFAANGGHLEAVRVLLEGGVSLDARDNQGISAGVIAAVRGHHAILSLLHEYGADLEQGTDPGNNPLMLAVDNGHFDAVKALLRAGVAVNEESANGSTAVTLAVETGRADILALAFEYGGDLTHTTHSNQNVMTIAALNGHIEVIEMLHRHGVSVNASMPDGTNATMMAAFTGNDDMLRTLKRLGANFNTAKSGNVRALHIAATKGNDAAVQVLLDGGAEIDAADDHRTTALITAVENGHVDVTKRLLANGASIDKLDLDACSATVHAVRIDSMQCLELLLRAKPDLEQQDYSGATPLIYSAAKGSAEAIARLLDAGANIDARNHGRQTALMISASRNVPEPVRLLCHRGAQLDLVDAASRTAASHAAVRGHVAVLEVLIASGADIRKGDGDGIQPVVLAAREGHVAAMETLLDGGADVDTRDRDDNTLLMHAAVSGHAEVVRKLIERGANLQAIDRYGRTAVQHAEQAGHDTIALQLNDAIGRTEAQSLAESRH